MEEDFSEISDCNFLSSGIKVYFKVRFNVICSREDTGLASLLPTFSTERMKSSITH